MGEVGFGHSDDLMAQMECGLSLRGFASTLVLLHE